MEKRLIQIFDKANNDFISEEKSLILSGVSERTLCGALMLFLSKEIRESAFRRYYVDVEYNRNNGKIKTIRNNREEVITINCDLIVHSRGNIIEQDNLLALEMKKSTASDSEKLKDKERLMALTKDTFDDVWSYDGKSYPEHVCRYILGVYYEVNIQKRTIIIEYYRKGNLFHKYGISF
ncbi:MAG: hypothetical protein BWY11_01823 [Firmicutes bacterium ADurb.Bin182]|nr:MAG: hypothetical protein BWY11_01823 [Firmicutes bacterium ADurb.Bin182]